MSKRTVYLAPYIHLPRYDTVKVAPREYRAIFEKVGYSGYIKKIASAILLVNPQVIYIEGRFQGDKVTDDPVSSHKLFAEFALIQKLLQGGCSLEGLENPELLNANLKLPVKPKKNSGICRKKLSIQWQKAASDRDKSWAEYVKSKIETNGPFVLSYGDDHHPEIFFHPEMTFELVYGDLRNDNKKLEEKLYRDVIILERELAKKGQSTFFA